MKRNCKIIFTTTLEEKNQIKENARRYNYSISSYLRLLGLAKIYPPGEMLFILEKKLKGGNKNG